MLEAIPEFGLEKLEETRRAHAEHFRERRRRRSHMLIGLNRSGGSIAWNRNTTTYAPLCSGPQNTTLIGRLSS